MAQPRLEPNAQDQQQQQQLQNRMHLLDALYCEEEQLDQPGEGEREESLSSSDDSHHRSNHRPPILTELVLFWDEGELRSLITKEEGECNSRLYDSFESSPYLARARREGLEWMLKVSARYSFSALTAVLAANYLDRFLASFRGQKETPWMSQLAAVACLSLAAKVEETQVPLLVDLQVEDARYVFEAKTIQRMEILVLSTLQWKMNPVTPLCFLDYMARRLGFKDRICWEFLMRSQRLLVSTLSDTKFLSYAPSVVAMAIMLQTIDELQPCIGVDSIDQILGDFDKGRVKDCGEIVRGMAKSGQSNKRKSQSVPGSPGGVIDASFSCDSSNDSWSATPSSVMSSSPEPLWKRNRRGQEEGNCLCIPR